MSKDSVLLYHYLSFAIERGFNTATGRFSNSVL